MGQEDSLTNLNLASNQLKTLPDLSSLRALEVLDISGNSFATDVQPLLFAKNKRLQVVKLNQDKVALLNQ